MKKRVLSLLLALVLVLGLFPARSLAASPTSGSCGKQGDNLTWRLEGSTLIIEGSGEMADYNFYDTRAPWEPYGEQITAIRLPDGLTKLDNYAFYHLTAVKTLHLPKQVSGVDVELLEHLDALESITVDPANPRYSALDGVLFNKDRTRLRFYPEAKPDTVYEVPDGIQSFSRYTFYGIKALEQVTIPGSVKTIESDVFRYCDRLKKVVLSEGLEEIEGGCIQQCTALTEINIPSSVKRLGYYFLYDTAFTNDPANRENGLLYLDNWLLHVENTFKGHLSLKPGTVGLAEHAVCNIPDMTGVTLPDTMRYICRYALKDNPGLKEIIFHEGVEFLDSSALANCSALERVYLPKSLTLMGRDVLEMDDALKEVHYAGSRADWDQIEIQGPAPFDPVRTDLIFGTDEVPDPQPPAGETFSGFCGGEGDGKNLSWTLKDGLLTVSGRGAMCDQPSWSNDRNRIKKAVIGTGVTSLGKDAFLEAWKLESVSLPETLKSIGAYTFKGCRGLKTLHLPASLAEISYTAFIDCAGLTSIDVAPGNPTFHTVDGVLFQTNGNVLLLYPSGRPGQSYMIPKNTRYLSQYAFQSSCRLRAIGIPDAHASVYMLRTLPMLADLYFGGTQQQWENWNGSYFGPDCGITIHCNWKHGAPMPAATKPFRTDNRNKQNYPVRTTPVYSYLHDNGDGTLSRVEALENLVILERYNTRRELIEQRIITRCSHELPIFGGCFFGTARNYLVFGQNNPAEDGYTEVLRVVSYSKDWKRLEDASIFGANTSIPFRAGSLRMAEYGDYLYVRTCHRMFKSDDGRNHQANLTLNIYTPAMALRDMEWEVQGTGGYASHSFNQFIALDGNKIFTVDHGDAYPRSVVLMEHPYPAGRNIMMGRCKETDLLRIAGAIGDNDTGVSLGGFEISDSSCLVAGNTVDQKIGNLEGQRNIFLSVLPKDTVGSGTPKLVMLTDYQANQNIDPSTPHLVKVDGSRLLVLWTEGKQESHYDYSSGPLCWQMVDGTGTPVTPIYKHKDGQLSDCKPILENGRVLWYATDRSAPVFYSIDPAHPEKLVIQNTVKTADPTKTYTVTVDGVAHKVQGSSTLAGLLPAENPAKPGYDFKGWFSGEVQVSEGTIVYEDMTILPAWTENPNTYTVTVDGKTYISTKHGTRLADLLPELPAKAGHTLRWYDHGTEIDPRSVIRSDLDLTHQWVFDVFTDVKEGQWFYNGVQYTTYNGLFSGVSPITFGPNIKMNRAMVVQVLYSMAGKPDVTPTNQFIDVPKHEWYAKAVAWAVENGVASGYPGGQFGSTDVINREQLAVMLHGYAKKPSAQGELNFADENDISGWAKTALQWAVENHIMSGIPGNKILPQGLAERSQGSVMIMQFHKLMTK